MACCSKYYIQNSTFHSCSNNMVIKIVTVTYCNYPYNYDSENDDSNYYCYKDKVHNYL